MLVITYQDGIPLLYQPLSLNYFIAAKISSLKFLFSVLQLIKLLSRVIALLYSRLKKTSWKGFFEAKSKRDTGACN